eukprot:TRINITY_DN6579_c0_g1_i2.p1 TRINITY_DN6579_c0_g1~~TRINITY_DN6579_c0_g1_i2.p1  ORF type:complete len:126 (-),score=24.31 TRINITY_DN6579_c0_g1_i2:414-791(-)
MYSEVQTKMTLENFMIYCASIQEQKPLYLFDNKFAEKTDMLKDYEVPIYFREDFFKLLEGQGLHRPSFRWILIGPVRSGATFHKDPNATSAWNGLISGRKKWIFYPPNIPPPGVFPSKDGEEVTL